MDSGATRKKVCKPVETESPRSDKETGEAQTPTNVVRIPRDWFGPREELVPFGPRASTTAVADAVRSELPDARDARVVNASELPPTGSELTGSLPPRPDDFWGEGAAAIHDAVQIPELAYQRDVLATVEQKGAVAVDPQSGCVCRPRSKPGAWRPRLRGAGVGRPWLASAAFTRWRPRGRSLVVGAIAAGLAAIAIASLSGPPAVRVSREANRNRGAARLTAIAPERQSAASAIAHLVQLAKQNPRDLGAAGRRGPGSGSKKPPAPRERAVRRESHRSTTTSGNSGGASSGSGSPVSVSYERASSSDAVASQASATQSPGGEGAYAGPVGPGAAFGPGRLG